MIVVGNGVNIYVFIGFLQRVALFEGCRIRYEHGRFFVYYILKLASFQLTIEIEDLT